ncbi:hypothetical protein Cob_v012093 [Colletotrichum orbiculare MAFF 240422]|uniref:Uncharacterized protein n=1 Tax=Colletotrichum orbiculare (strain 104-T / ATCC 96160 / CBS 514.97 / LARS 414 / MAFF 240422) TaxID=1213857 RepID=A0A484FAN6_COLOR|nr:hypothetical protein Cob_v012093 [Colletotrichum orbiculare MAFF 240422]
MKRDVERQRDRGQKQVTRLSQWQYTLQALRMATFDWREFLLDVETTTARRLCKLEPAPAASQSPLSPSPRASNNNGNSSNNGNGDSDSDGNR